MRKTIHIVLRTRSGHLFNATIESEGRIAEGMACVALVHTHDDAFYCEGTVEEILY